MKIVRSDVGEPLDLLLRKSDMTHLWCSARAKVPGPKVGCVYATKQFGIKLCSRLLRNHLYFHYQARKVLQSHPKGCSAWFLTQPLQKLSTPLLTA